MNNSEQQLNDTNNEIIEITDKTIELNFFNRPFIVITLIIGALGLLLILTGASNTTLVIAIFLISILFSKMFLNKEISKSYNQLKTGIIYKNVPCKFHRIQNYVQLEIDTILPNNYNLKSSKIIRNSLILKERVENLLSYDHIDILFYPNKNNFIIINKYHLIPKDNNINEEKHKKDNLLNFLPALVLIILVLFEVKIIKYGVPKNVVNTVYNSTNQATVTIIEDNEELKEIVINIDEKDYESSKKFDKVYCNSNICNKNKYGLINFNKYSIFAIIFLLILPIIYNKK